MRRALVFLLLLLGAPWNPNVYEQPGVTYEEHIARGEAFIAQVRAYATEHCGEPYLGTVCG